jgi:TRAP transporter 4TM/12TM fusion protein
MTASLNRPPKHPHTQPTGPTIDGPVELTQEELDRLTADSEGGPARRVKGVLGFLLGAACFLLSAYALYWTQFSVNTTLYRASFLAAVLALVFLLFPFRKPEEATRRTTIEEWIVAALGLGIALALIALPNTFMRTPVSGALAVATALCFAAYPVIARVRVLQTLLVVDWIFAALAVAIAAYLTINIEDLKTAATRPPPEALALGAILIVLTLEATRRTVGWILPALTAVFLLYCHYGPSIPEPFDHRGFSINRIVGQNFLTLEGIYSTPIDVAATFIILFTIYGAVLDKGGAGKFFIDWAFALFGKKPSPSAPGRAVVASGFLLGTVSGSGVATTVTVASLAWPMLKRSGYHPNVAGGMLSAAGIGATLSPPTLGAAAFIIAEYLNVEYLQVLIYAMIPTLLYYVSCWLMTEADARRLGVMPVKTSDASLWQLTLREGYHFLSLGAIAVFLALGYSSFMSVFWSIVIAFGLSMIRPESRLVTLPAFAIGVVSALLIDWFADRLFAVDDVRLSVGVFLGMMIAVGVSGLQALVSTRTGRSVPEGATRMIEALTEGSRSVLGIAATCACAGILVSVVNLTGLGLTLSGMIVSASQAAKGAISLFGFVVEIDAVRLATIFLAALAMWILGLAVPVTASYIIAAVMLVPALERVGIAAPAAHMFMFYYAVLADVSPPTALAPFAASAITGGRPFATMMQAWKYTLPAFLVPFMFCLTPDGLNLLMLTPAAATPGTLAEWGAVLWVTLTSCIALLGLVIGCTNWCLRRTNPVERWLATLGGLLMLASGPLFDAIGFAVLAGAIGMHWLRARGQPATTEGTAPT